MADESTATAGAAASTATSQQGDGAATSLLASQQQQSAGQQQPAQQQQAPTERPDWMPEKFWTDKGPNVEMLAKSYHGLEQLLGKKAQALIPPSDKSTPEELAEWRKALGVPETADGYELRAPDKLPDGVTWDDATAKKVAEIAHKHHIPAAAIKDLLAFDLERQAGRAALDTETLKAMAETEHKEALADLKKTFGDKMDTKIALAQRAVATVGGDPNSRGFSDPAVVKVLVGLAEKLSDDTLVAAGQATPQSGKSAAKDIQTNPQNPLYAQYQAGDPEIVDRVRRMLSAA